MYDVLWFIAGMGWGIILTIGVFSLLGKAYTLGRKDEKQGKELE